MTTSTARGVLVASAVVASACGPTVYAAAIGAPRAPLATPCGAHIERIAPADANAKYTQVGTLCASSVRSLDGPTLDVIESDPDVHALMEEKACALGGNVLVPAGFCSTGSGRSSRPAIDFGVYTVR